MGSMSNKDNSLTFGSWNGKPISFVQGGYFSTQVQQIKAQLESQGYKDSGDQFFAFQVWRRAFENTAVHLGLLDLSQKAGISVSDSFLDRQMIGNQAFVENGVFSKRKYREASNSFKLSLRKEIAQSTLKQRFVSDTVGFMPSDAETAFLKGMAQSQRVIEYVAIPFSAYPDAERLAWAKANPAAFRRVRLSKVTLSSSRKEAEQVLAKVKSGELSFEEAAKNHSRDSYAAKGGDMGARYQWELKGELKNESDLDTVVAAPKGDLSAVYDTLAGSWSFYRVEEAATEPDFASADLLKTVTAYLDRNEKGRLEDYAVASAARFATAAATSFGNAAASAGYVVKETKPFPLNYGTALDIGYFSLLGSLDTADLPELKGADRDERFLQAVFSLKAGELSAPIVLNDQAIVVRVKEIKNADDGEMGLLEAYYPTVVQQGVSSELASSILASPYLKDDFMATFSRVYSQAN
jgi:parvulin-like peptidyl-prolyl isomerase